MRLHPLLAENGPSGLDVRATRMPPNVPFAGYSLKGTYRPNPAIRWLLHTLSAFSDET